MPANQADLLADNLAQWALDLSDKMAESIKGGTSAPNAQNLTEQQKLDYYTSQFFNPDGTPNTQGRAATMERLGAAQFADTYKAVITAHPELKSPEVTSPPVGFRGPDGLPGTDIAPDGLPMTGATVAPARGTPLQISPMPEGPIAPDGLPDAGGEAS